jgi:small multidrug resistance family-3 protein
MKNVFTELIATPAGMFVVLSIAAFLEVYGDACFQSGLYQSTGASRGWWFLGGTLILASYGLFVNLSRLDFGKLLGIYVVLFFVVAQIVAKVRFQQSPSTPTLVGGAFIVVGGLVMTFWKG